MIVSTWAKAGLFPLDSSVVLKRMKKYFNPQLEPNLPVVDNLFQTPKTILFVIVFSLERL
jgi:hypothetical protein